MVKEYVVLERTDIERLKRKDQEKFNLICKKAAELRHLAAKPELLNIVIESDDPDYETVAHMKSERAKRERIEKERAEQELTA